MSYNSEIIFESVDSFIDKQFISDYIIKAKSVKKDCIYYAIHSKSKNKTFAVIVKYEKEKALEGCLLRYKAMSESELPYYFEAPNSLLKKLSPTNCKYSLEWRKGCEELNYIKSLKTGDKVELKTKLKDMTTVIFGKRKGQKITILSENLKKIYNIEIDYLLEFIRGAKC